MYYIFFRSRRIYILNAIKTDFVLNAQGLSCPMPIVKTKKSMNELQPGQVMEVQATDPGSRADIQAWAKSTGHQYLGTIEEGKVLKHYLRKSSQEETIERKHPYVITNEELQTKIANDEEIVIVDVREPAEYAFNHIENAVSIPLGDVESRCKELNENDLIYVICRSGNRSDLAAQILSEKGFKQVFNVVPGMDQWTTENYEA